MVCQLPPLEDTFKDLNDFVNVKQNAHLHSMMLSALHECSLSLLFVEQWHFISIWTPYWSRKRGKK